MRSRRWILLVIAGLIVASLAAIRLSRDAAYVRSIIPAGTPSPGSTPALSDNRIGLPLLRHDDGLLRPLFLVASPTFVDHPPVTDGQASDREGFHSLDSSAFMGASGCGHDLQGPGIRCGIDGPVRWLGCVRLEPLPEGWGSIASSDPLVAYCPPWAPPGSTAPIPAIYVTGCMFPHGIRYLAYRDDRFELVDSVDRLRDVFAPIRSEGRALLYAMAATGFQPQYGLGQDARLSYFSGVVEDTYVKATPSGYSLHLYHYAYCGCGPHVTEAVYITVTHSGDMAVFNIERVFDDGFVGGCLD